MQTKGNPEGGSEGRIEEKIKVLQLICFFMLFPAVLLGVLPHLGVLPAPPEKIQIDFPLKEVLYLIAVVDLVLAYFLRKMLFRPRRTAELRLDQAASMQSYTLATIVSFAIMESVSILGFVYFMLQRDANASTLFSAVSAAAMVLSWPSRSEFDQRLQSRDQHK